MKAISLHQPWASLMVTRWPEGRFCKRFETRSFRTLYRGPIAICATKTFPQVLYGLIQKEPFASALKHWECSSDIPVGCVLGIGQLAHCERVEEACLRPSVTFTERHFGDYSPGRWAWLIDDMRPLPEPIPVKGKQGLWDWPEGEAVLKGLANV